MMASRPVAFFCHASEDDEFARPIARALMDAGINTFFDEWSIGTGDSIRQRIDQGLLDCTHFVVLLTEISITKDWVNTEIDAGIELKIRGQAAFLPIRSGLSMARLRSRSPLLATRQCPEISNTPDGANALISEIYSVSKKPPLGSVPPFAAPPAQRVEGLSNAACRIAQLMVTRSKLGRARDPLFKYEEVLAETGLLPVDLKDAVEELESKRLVAPLTAIGCGEMGFYGVESTAYLFVALDLAYMGWNPKVDAVAVAADLINSGAGYRSSSRSADALGWDPRRFNPALSFLEMQRLVRFDRTISRTFVANSFLAEPGLKAFLRSSS